jgi:hypothetical protein
MQFIFFVPPKEELEGTLHPQKFGCTPKNEGKRVHVLPDEKTCGHAGWLRFLVGQKLSNFEESRVFLPRAIYENVDIVCIEIYGIY